MIEAGISRIQLANIFAKHLPGDRSARMKKAWEIVKEIDNHSSPGDCFIVDTLGACPKCLQTGWLIEVSGATIKCLNCGESFLLISEK